ncbi:MAG TPA: hypothetical protein VNA04_12920 [Thermoanaerobaculia bacterium]|nr:hypothetical protein [Thermoanaerobaculia bacterium]
MKLTTLAAAALLLAPAAAADLLDCNHTAPHRLTAALDGATSVAVIGRAGTLLVRGENVNAVTASGTACASDREFLGRMRIEARREGSEVVVEAVIPEKMVLFGWHHAKLDLEVIVPNHLPVRVKDGSGKAEISDVASLDVVDGSGELVIRGVRGSLEVRDGSGSMRISDVGGDIRLTDGSGSVEIARVGGTVRVIADGSGSLDIRDVQRDVIIESDGSGSITVSDVRGDFIVERDGSGGIDYQRVGGQVRLPRRR